MYKILPVPFKGKGNSTCLRLYGIGCLRDYGNVQHDMEIYVRQKRILLLIILKYSTYIHSLIAVILRVQL